MTTTLLTIGGVDIGVATATVAFALALLIVLIGLVIAMGRASRARS